MIFFKVEDQPKRESSALGYAIGLSMVICMKAFICKATSIKTESQSFRLAITIISILGYVIFSYYKAQLNAALNVDNNDVSIESWTDVAESNYRLLTWSDSFTENTFRMSYDGDDFQGISPLKKIYIDKVKNEQVKLDKIDYKEGIKKVLSDDWIIFGNSEPYLNMEEYPCQVMPLKYPQMRYFKCLR